MKTAMRCGLVVGMLAVAAVIVGVAAAEDVIVKQGTIGTGSVSPDERAKVFITDGPDDICYHEGGFYGLLSMTTDPTEGTENRCGLLCEFFADAELEMPGATAAWLFNYPVGTEADCGYYYALAAYTAGGPGYSTNGKNVGLTGVYTTVDNSNNVAGGDYATTGLYVSAKPVENGYDMTGALTFRNCGIDVTATLDGDYQATSGTGDNFGIYVETKNELDGVADQAVNSYALYLKAFPWDPRLGGGQTYGIYQEGPYTMNYFEGDISADDVTDRTPGYSGTPQEALNEILNVRSVEGEIDHSSLPPMARATLNRIEKTNVRIVERTDPTGKVIQEEQYDVRTVAEEGRSLGAMITVLTEAVKGLNEKIEALQAENQSLEAEIAALKAQ